MTNKNIKETDCAWTAGLIDGEGCIYIHRSRPKNGAINPCFSLKVRVGMIHMPTIQKLKDLWGGYYSERKVKQKNSRNQAIWEVSSKNAEFLLKYIICFLITKKEEAILALEFLTLPKATQFKETPLWLLNKRQELFHKIKALKRIEYRVTYKKEIKILKRDIKSICSVCHKEMNKYNENGILKTACSNKCKFSKRRILTNEQEKELLDLRLNKNYTYQQLAERFNIKKGSVGWILNKLKTNASI